MSRIMVAVISLFMAMMAYAGQKAITDTGEEVILNSDGTWAYANKASGTKKTIDTNKKEFSKPDSSTFLLKSSKNNSAFWVDANKWSFKKAATNAEAEYEFQLKDNDLYGLVITEAIQIPIESLSDLAFENAKNVAPDISVVNKEYRYVNGHKVIYMEMSGTMQGIKITYFGYYYSDESGSTQWMAFTGTSLAEKYMQEISDFLNGLDVQ
jgi:hypothetical protein